MRWHILWRINTHGTEFQNVKMCFDLGHAHCYGDEKELFKNLEKHIVCTHLHNNFGKDTHNILNDGEIDYSYFLKLLKQSNFPNFKGNIEAF